MSHPMGEAKPGPFRDYFDLRLKLEFHGSDILPMGVFFPTATAIMRLDWLSRAEWFCRRRAAAALDKLAPSGH